MNGYIYNATKNEREVLDSEKLRLIIKTEGNKTVIDGGKIMTNSITAKSISANSIYAEHISTDAIKTGHVSAGSIVSTHIKAEAILSTHIQSDTILARHIKADQINSNHIIANTILTKHIKANEIEAKHIKAGEVILPDEKYGGVYINSTGLNMINTGNHIALSAEKGLKIHNSLKGKTVFWANPTTGDIEMDVNKLTINSSDVYTKDNLNIGINNRIVYSQNGQSLNWFIGEYEVGHISLQNSERDGIKVKKFTKIKNSTSWVYYGISPSGIYKSLNMNPLEDWILTMKVYTEDIFNIKPLLCDGSGLNLNISFESLKTKKGWQILNFKGKTSGTVSPDKNNMIYISVGGLPSGIVLEHDWIMLSQGNTNIMNWSPSPDDIFNKEDINSRFILENDKIELNVNKKVDGLAPPTNNLLLNSKTKSSSVNGQYTFVTLKGIDSESLESHYTKLEPGEQYTITTRAKASPKGETIMYLQNVPEYNFSQVITFSSQELETKSVTFRIPKTSPINQKWSIAIYDMAKLGGSYHEWTTLTKGNMTSPDWIDSSGDSYNKAETNAQIKLESDNIKLGVTEEIKYSGLGNENMIINSSGNNCKPSLIIEGVQRYSAYRATPYYDGDWTKIVNFNTTEHHLYDIGSSISNIAHVGFDKYNFAKTGLKGGDYVTFSAELWNVDTNLVKLEMFYQAGNGWTTSQGSKELKKGEKELVYVTTKVPEGTTGILFRVYTGNQANGTMYFRNLMAIKGTMLQDWKANPADLVNNIYNPNLFENSNFDETLSIGYVAKNPDNYARRWTMYNGEIANPTTSYHSYISDWKFGFNVMVFDESDGTRHWKAAHQSLNAEDIKIVQTGGNLWFSLDMYKEGVGLDNARVWVEMYYYNKAGARGFHSGQSILKSTIVKEWERNSCSVPFNHEDVDWTKEILFYIYGYTFTDNSKLYIKNVKLEIGKYVTPYQLASKDVVKISEFKDVQLSLEPDAITQTITSSQTFAEWSDEAIGGKANQVDLNITNEELEKTKKEIVTTVDKVGELKTQADVIEGSVTTITKRVEGQEEHTERTKKFFTFDDDFLTIKKSDSLFNINITNEQMSFRNGKVETAFINGQKLFITEAQILKTIIVGSHQIQTEPATKQTIFKYIG